MKRPVQHVLHVTEATGAGVLSYITMLANQQAAQGLAVSVLLLGHRPDRPADVRSSFTAGIQVAEVAVTSGGALTRVAFFAKAIRAAIRSGQPDVLHLHSSIAGAVGRLATLGLGARRVIYQPHGLSYLREDKSSLLRSVFLAMEWLLGCLPAALIAVSRTEAEQLRRVRGKGIHLVENGVLASEIPASRQVSSRLRIGTVNRICAQKDPVFFRDVVRRLRPDQFEWVWVGGGDDALAALLIAGGIRVTGWLPRTQALAEMAEFDIYLQTSRWEGMPLSLIEAQIAGVPAVARAVIGNREVIERTGGGVLVETVNEAVAAIEALARNPAQRTYLGALARAQATAEFSIERIARQLDLVYQS